MEEQDHVVDFLEKKRQLEGQEVVLVLTIHLQRGRGRIHMAENRAIHYRGGVWSAGRMEQRVFSPNVAEPQKIQQSSFLFATRKKENLATMTI